MANNRSKRFFGDDFREDDVIVRIGGYGSNARQLRGVRRQHVTTTGKEGFVELNGLLDNDRFHLQIVGAKIIGHVLFRRRSRQGAHTCPLQFFRAFDPQLFRNEKTLPVIIIGLNKIQPQVRVTGQRPSGIPAQDVHLFRLDRGKPGLRSQGHKLDLFRIPKNGGRNRPRGFHIQPSPDTLFIGHAETKESTVDPYREDPPGLYRLQSFAGSQHSWSQQQNHGQ